MYSCLKIFLVLNLIFFNIVFAGDDQQEIFLYTFEIVYPGAFGKGAVVRGPLAVEEVEALSLEKLKTCGRCPQVPFGSRNHAWRAFKGELQKGDVLIFFRTDTDSWQKLRGREGYAILRKGLMYKVFVTGLN